MIDPHDSEIPEPDGDATVPPIDDADAMIAWWLSDEFDGHIDRCFAEGKRKALEERDRFLREQAEKAANDSSDTPS